MFDNRFVVILECSFDEHYHEMLDWINQNSNGAVEIQIYPPVEESNESWYAPSKIKRRTIYIGFENTDDALFFKIKYSL